MAAKGEEKWVALKGGEIRSLKGRREEWVALKARIVDGEGRGKGSWENSKAKKLFSLRLLEGVFQLYVHTNNNNNNQRSQARLPSLPHKIQLRIGGKVVKPSSKQ